MKSKQVIGQGGLRIWVAVLDPGDEAKSVLEGFARSLDIESASFVAIGAFERATLGYFDWNEKRYVPIPIGQQAEVLSFIGDVVRDENDAVSLRGPEPFFPMTILVIRHSTTGSRVLKRSFSRASR